MILKNICIVLSPIALGVSFIEYINYNDKKREQKKLHDQYRYDTKSKKSELQQDITYLLKYMKTNNINTKIKEENSPITSADLLYNLNKLYNK